MGCPNAQVGKPITTSAVTFSNRYKLVISVITNFKQHAIHLFVTYCFAVRSMVGLYC